MATKKKSAPKKAAKKAPAKKPVAKKAVKKKSKAVKTGKTTKVGQATASSPVTPVVAGKSKSRIRTRKSDGAQLILCPFWLPVGLKADLDKECGKTIWPSNYAAQAISEKLYKDNGKSTKR